MGMKYVLGDQFDLLCSSDHISSFSMVTKKNGQKIWDVTQIAYLIHNVSFYCLLTCYKVSSRSKQGQLQSKYEQKMQIT